jgi:rare lipoprotein A
MLKKQDVRAVAADKHDRYKLFARWQLGSIGPSLTGLLDLRHSLGSIPENEIRLFDKPLSRFTAGLLRHLVPGLVAGACLAGIAGPACANQSSPRQETPWLGENGVASYYGARHQGRRTASGARFEQTGLTAAHPWLPFGTKVRVTVEGGRSVVVTITDRLFSRRRVIDLSLGAARVLGIVHQGIAEVSLSPA